MTRTAFILISGRPNVGKSTLLNAMVGEKVAIVSRKPQTTRNRITGILTKGEDQYVFIDTPGLHKPKTLLGEYMMKSIGSAAAGADLVLFVMEAGKRIGESEKNALLSYINSGLNVFVILNKVDKADKGDLAVQIGDLAPIEGISEIIPISALQNDGVDIIFRQAEKLLVESPHFFPDDSYTDQPEKQILAEIIREKILKLLDDEIPHGIAVVIEEYTEKKNAVVARAEIFCEKETHKRILIGKNGELLKRIGMYAREDAEQLLGTKVYIDLWVKVKEKWRDKPFMLSNFGYKNEEL